MPAARHGASFQLAISSGKFHGTIWPQTRTGSRVRHAPHIAASVAAALRVWTEAKKDAVQASDRNAKAPLYLRLKTRFQRGAGERTRDTADRAEHQVSAQRKHHARFHRTEVHAETCRRGPFP